MKSDLKERELMSQTKDIINWVIENYQDELQEIWHNQHEKCGEVTCIDAGGAVITDTDFEYVEKELAELYWQDNYKELKPLWVKNRK